MAVMIDHCGFSVLLNLTMAMGLVPANYELMLFSHQQF